MNDPRDHDSRLIADALNDDWDKGAPAQFARAAAAHARKRRRTKQAVLASTASAGVVVAAFVMLTSPSRTPAISTPVASHQAKAVRGYEIISDAQLLAELRDRSVVMVRQGNGRNDFVLVGQDPDESVSALR